MKKLAPLISSRVTGPLGILHLPRFWLKASLEGVGLLPEGYWVGKGALPADSNIPDAATLNDLDDWMDFWVEWIKK
jgi:hypothetical protein